MCSLLPFRLSVSALAFIFCPLHSSENWLNRKKVEPESWPPADPAKENSRGHTVGRRKVISDGNSELQARAHYVGNQN